LIVHGPSASEKIALAFFFAYVEQRTAAVEVVIESLPDIRASIALDTSVNVYGLGQFEVSVG
jgi:hypothetical protein